MFLKSVDAFHTSVQQELVKSSWKLDDPFECFVHCGSIKLLHHLVLPAIELKTLQKPLLLSLILFEIRKGPILIEKRILSVAVDGPVTILQLMIRPGYLDKGFSLWPNDL